MPRAAQEAELNAFLDGNPDHRFMVVFGMAGTVISESLAVLAVLM